MNIESTIEELSKRLGPPRFRAAFGQWLPYAWLVRGLVERGHGVTDAVNTVLGGTGFAGARSSFGSLRAAYYKIRTRPWPAQSPQSEEVEGGFE